LVRERVPPVPVVDPKLVGRLLDDLSHPRFTVRERANRELQLLGTAAEPALREFLRTAPPAEGKRRAENLLAILEESRVRMARTVELLEHLSTPEAKQLLQSLSEGARGARLTEESAASLKRLQKEKGH